jgi:hypothetical protein
MLLACFRSFGNGSVAPSGLVLCVLSPTQLAQWANILGPLRGSLAEPTLQNAPLRG